MKAALLLIPLLALACSQGADPAPAQDTTATADTREAEDTLTLLPDLIPWPAGSCPPQGPYGIKEGTTLTTLTFEDCEGNLINLDDFCGSRALLIYNLYGWCPSCHDYLLWIKEIAPTLRPQGLEALVVITEDGIAGPPSRDYCAGLKAHYGLEVPVLLDPSGKLKDYGGVGLVLLLQQGGVIVLNQDKPSKTWVEKLIEELIG